MDLKEHAEHLRSLGEQKPSDKDRAALIEALGSKHDGISVVAAQSLCRWGDIVSVEAVKAAVWELSAKPMRYSATSAICRALAPVLQKTGDISWAISIFAEQAHRDNRYFMGAQLFEAFPSALVLAKLQAIPKASDTRHNLQRDIQSAIKRAEYRHRTEA